MFQKLQVWLHGKSTAVKITQESSVPIMIFKILRSVTYGYDTYKYYSFLLHLVSLDHCAKNKFNYILLSILIITNILQI